MKRKITGWLIAAVIVTFAVIWGLWFFSPGVHTFLFWTRIDQSGTCYVFDPVSAELVNETNYQICGTASPMFKTFEGRIRVDAYSHDGDPIDINGGMSWREDADIRIHYTDAVYTEEYVVIRDGRQMPKRDVDYQTYTIWLTGDRNRDIVLQIAGIVPEDGVIICADNVPEAERILDNWLNKQ